MKHSAAPRCDCQNHDSIDRGPGEQPSGEMYQTVSIVLDRDAAMSDAGGGHPQLMCGSVVRST